MQNIEVLSIMKRVFNDVLKIQDFKDGLSMDNLDEWDSLKHIAIILELEKELDLQFSHDEIIEMTSTEAISLVIQKHIKISYD